MEKKECVLIGGSANSRGLRLVALVTLAGLTVTLSGCTASVSSAPVSPSQAEQPTDETTAEATAEPEVEAEPEIQKNPEIRVFVASDVSDEIALSVEQTLNLARGEWGLKWDLDYWVLGLDEQASVELVGEHCTRRDAAGFQAVSACMQRESARGDNSMFSYYVVAERALAEGQPSGSAARNGFAEWKLHNFVSSYPWGLGKMFGVPGDDDLKTVLHEYWHAVQSEAISFDAPRFLRERLMGPVWFVEGSAEYMAQHTRAKLRANGSLPEVNPGEYPYDFSEQMQYKLWTADESAQGECAGRLLTTLVEYNDPCSFLGYEKGAWAIAYLAHLTDQDVLLKSFHPNVEQMGWQEAFEMAAGMTLPEFEADFETFMTGNDSERLAILPKF